MPAIVLDNVDKIYPGPVTALRQLTLEARPGEYLAVVGPSACGKTTALRLIAGLESPTAGRVRFDHRDVTRLPPARRGVGMVFQSYALYPHLTVRENLAFAAAGIGREEVRRRVLDAARSLGLEAALDRRPAELSGGERQRAALGRCLVRQPDTTLLDEPLSNLDAPLRAAARTDLKTLHRRIGSTTIHVTHDQEEALSLGDRVAVMSRARLEQVAPPLEIYHRPANRFVAAFLGSPTMNFLPGRIERHEGLAFVETGTAGLRLHIPPRLAPRFAPGLDRNTVLGFRPTALFLHPSRDAAHPTLTLVAQALEPLGDVIDVRCVTPAGAPLIARLPRHSAVDPGHPLTLTLDLSRAHLFEPGDFGKRLSRDGDD